MIFEGKGEGKGTSAEKAKEDARKKGFEKGRKTVQEYFKEGVKPSPWMVNKFRFGKAAPDGAGGFQAAGPTGAAPPMRRTKKPKRARRTRSPSKSWTSPR